MFNKAHYIPLINRVLNKHLLTRKEAAQQMGINEVTLGFCMNPDIATTPSMKTLRKIRDFLIKYKETK